jgi:hypothetical protein
LNIYLKKEDILAKRIRATAEAKLDPEWERACAMANDLKSKDGTVLWALSFIHAWEDTVKMIKETL